MIVDIFFIFRDAVNTASEQEITANVTTCRVKLSEPREYGSLWFTSIYNSKDVEEKPSASNHVDNGA